MCIKTSNVVQERCYLTGSGVRCETPDPSATENAPAYSACTRSWNSRSDAATGRARLRTRRWVVGVVGSTAAMSARAHRATVRARRAVPRHAAYTRGRERRARALQRRRGRRRAERAQVEPWVKGVGVEECFGHCLVNAASERHIRSRLAAAHSRRAGNEAVVAPPCTFVRSCRFCHIDKAVVRGFFFFVDQQMVATRCRVVVAAARLRAASRSFHVRPTGARA